jgi:hypothetical protein
MAVVEDQQAERARAGGQGGSTYGRSSAGERLIRAVILPPGRCGTVSGAIGFDPDLGPGAKTAPMSPDVTGR